MMIAWSAVASYIRLFAIYFYAGNGKLFLLTIVYVLFIIVVKNTLAY
jgi:hypothetical protein